MYIIKLNITYNSQPKTVALYRVPIKEYYSSQWQFVARKLNMSDLDRRSSQNQTRSSPWLEEQWREDLC